VTPPRPPPSPREEFEALVDALVEAALDRGRFKYDHRADEIVAAARAALLDARDALARRLEFAERVDAEWADFEDRLDAFAVAVGANTAHMAVGAQAPSDAKAALVAAFRGLRAEVSLLTHKVLTCGVAASHPDPALSRTGAYAGKWDSPQAEEVRKLRDERDALARRAEEAEARLQSYAYEVNANRTARADLAAAESRALAAETGWKAAAADLASETARANRAEERAEKAERALADEKAKSGAACLGWSEELAAAERALSERTRRVEALRWALSSAEHAMRMAAAALHNGGGIGHEEVRLTEAANCVASALSSSPEEKARPLVHRNVPARPGDHVMACGVAVEADTNWSIYPKSVTCPACLAAPAATPDPTTKETDRE
jgi:hypothetical protein